MHLDFGTDLCTVYIDGTHTICLTNDNQRQYSDAY